MLESNTPVPPGSGTPLFDQPKATSDSTDITGSSSESSWTPTQPGSVYAYDERLAARGNHRVRFGSGEALDDLNNRYIFNLRSPNESPGIDQPPPLEIAQTPSVTYDISHIYPRTEYFRSPIDVDSLGAYIQEREFVPKIQLGVSSFGSGDEREMSEKYDQFHKSEQLPTKKMAARLGSFSAPSSAQTSPLLNPISPLNSCIIGACRVQGVGPVNVIPPLDLGRDVEVTDIYKKPEARSRTIATKEASYLVRQHTQRQARAAAGDTIGPSSGAVTPVACRHEDYVQPPDHFRGGILGSLLKLYNPPHHEGSLNHSHHGYSNSIASTVVGSPTASGRTTPKWYNKSANASTTSLGGLLVASGSALATPAVGIYGKNARPKSKHWPHCGGVVEAIKTFSGKSLEEEIKVRYIYYSPLCNQTLD